MKAVTLKKNNDFRKMYSRGKQTVSPALVVYIMKNRTSSVRYGITASKKIGCAVERNRARRVIREAFFNILPQISTGYDIVFVARSRTTKVKSTYIEDCMTKIFSNAGVLR